MTTPRRYTCIVNRESAAGAALPRLRAALGRMPGLMRRCDVVTVRSRAEMRTAVHDLPVGSVPVAVGGDGTLNWLETSLWEAGRQDRPLAVLPMGTGNAFAHSLGLGSLRVALGALECGVERAVDLMVTSHPAVPVALVSLSVGFESRFLRGVAAARTWRRVMTGARALGAATARPWARCTLTVDGERLTQADERVYNAGLYAMPCYALGRVVLPEADPGDGAAEAVVSRSWASYWRTLRRGVRLLTERVPADPTMRRFRTAVFETDEPLQVDGESVPAAPLEVRVQAGALRVLVPRPPRTTVRSARTA